MVGCCAAIKGVLFNASYYRAAPDMQKALIHGIGAFEEAPLLGQILQRQADFQILIDLLQGKGCALIADFAYLFELAQQGKVSRFMLE